MTSRTVWVPRERLARWLDGFAERHGAVEVAPTSTEVGLQAADGAAALISVPFPPGEINDLDGLIRHATQDRAVAVLLARKGGHAVGWFAGARLVASKTGHRYVQGRTKAGGWSQQRYARRRAGQATQASQAAAQAVRTVFEPILTDPAAGRIRWLVLGGDKAAAAEVLADPAVQRLGLPDPIAFHPTADPRQRVLADFPATFLKVRIDLNDLA